MKFINSCIYFFIFTAFTVNAYATNGNDSTKLWDVNVRSVPRSGFILATGNYKGSHSKTVVLGGTSARCPNGTSPYGTAYVVETQHQGDVVKDINGIRNSVYFDASTYQVKTKDLRAFVPDDFESSSKVTVQWIIYCL